MTSLRMGIANRITEERYNQAKAELKSPKDDKRVMRKYGFGATTAMNIRNTDNFYEYRMKSKTGKARREHLQCALADAQNESKCLPEREPEYLPHEDEPVDRIIAFCVVMVIMIALVIGGLAFLIVRGS